MPTNKTEVENKLDEDFLFYLGFTNSSISQVVGEDVEQCRAWLQKLCGEPCASIDEKRNRNVYLSNLLLCMQEGKLSEPFKKSPAYVDISNAMKVFGHLPPNVVAPEWLEGIANAADEGDERNDGRTYLATRTLPGGEGAFAYLAVTLADEEPRWLGGGEGVFDRAMEEKFKEYVPPMTEMEQILLRRKDPVEREKVIAFYDGLLQNINKELEEEILPDDNEVVNALIEQLVEDLRRRGQFYKFELMGTKQQRTELVLLLHSRLYARREKIMQREDVLDDIEQKTMARSFFDVSVQEQDKIELPAAMWEQAINKQPNKKHMDSLFDHYPRVLIEKFLNLLCNEKEEIAMRMQRRHENIVAQMRKELRKEGEKGKTKVEDAERSCQQAAPVLAAIKAAYTKQQEQKDQQTNYVHTDKSQLYDQMRSALYDTQRSVEEEAERGRRLTEQINAMNEQTEKYQQVNDDSIRKMEMANIELMKNIKRLRAAVKQHEQRIGQLQAMRASTSIGQAKSQQFFVY